MEGIAKQSTGFRFGKYKLLGKEILGEVIYNGRKYRIQKVITHEGEEYIALRLYNKNGKFIKQFLIEPEISSSIGEILISYLGANS